MGERIERVAVLGAGIMGSGIAAHLANAGARVLLLDMVPPDLSAEEKSDPDARNRLAAAGLKQALEAKPAAFFAKRRARLVEVGNFEDDLHRLAECDWVVEAVVERLDVKRELFARVAEAVRPGTPVTSNTSGLSVAGMSEGLSPEFQKTFFVTHFFNPARYMRLLEIVPGERTDPASIARVAAFCAQRLGKGVVHAKDTPNFIANRVGTFSLMVALHLMVEHELTIDEVDAIVGKPLGRPKSAAFRTADLVGLDTLLHVAQNCHDNLPDDERRAWFDPPDFVNTMRERGLLGQKAGAGFYKKVSEPEKQILTLDWTSLEYVPQSKPRFDSVGAARAGDTPGARVKLLVEGEDRAARFAWRCLGETLAYAARRIGEIADDVVNVDRAMRWGFNWALGPFELWDALGVSDAAERMRADGIDVPERIGQALEAGMTGFYRVHDGQRQYWDFAGNAYRPVPQDPKTIEVAHLKRERSERVLARNESASLLDLGDGVALLEFHATMNAIDQGVVELAEQACETVEGGDWLGLVVGNDGSNFSVGANLFHVLGEAMAKNWDNLERAVRAFQGMTQRFRYSPKPVVAAPFGMTLGGGAEVAMGCARIRAHAELYMGLVEAGVGLVPAGGGCLMLLQRCLGNAPDDPDFDAFPAIRRAFMTIGLGRVSTSAEQALEMCFLDPRDGVTLNRDHLLHDAKQTALGLARAGYRPPLPARLRLPGRGASATIGMTLYGMKEGHQISEHDLLIGTKLAGVLTGGDCAPATPVSETHVLDLEREAFLSLCGQQKTLERMNHMIQHNKPLRN